MLLILAGIFSCGKEDNENSLFAGTTWETKTDDVTVVLNFINDSVCTLSSSREGIYSTNMESYLYRLHGMENSMFFDVMIYKKTDDINTETIYFGYIEQNNLLLKTIEGVQAYPAFKKRK
jgi:hypothetical protein